MVLYGLLVRGSVLRLTRSVSTGKAVMDAGKRAAARYAVDTYVKVSLCTLQAYKVTSYLQN